MKKREICTTLIIYLLIAIFYQDEITSFIGHKLYEFSTNFNEIYIKIVSWILDKNYQYINEYYRIVSLVILIFFSVFLFKNIDKIKAHNLLSIIYRFIVATIIQIFVVFNVIYTGAKSSTEKPIIELDGIARFSASIAYLGGGAKSIGGGGMHVGYIVMLLIIVVVIMFKYYKKLFFSVVKKVLSNKNEKDTDVMTLGPGPDKLTKSLKKHS